MKNWREVYPGFFLPIGWSVDTSRFPDYTADGYIEKAGGEYLGTVEGEDGEEIARRPRVLGVDPRDVIRLGEFARPSAKAWAAWFAAKNGDKPLTRGWAELEQIADMTYSTARFKHLTPLWRQALIKIITELDDVEDQLSTIIWIASTVARKWIPRPLLPALKKADDITRSLDCAQQQLAGIGTPRTAKSAYAECVRNKQRRARQLIEQKKGLLAWLRNNYGKLLEAAQASNTWTDYGISLGPIMAVIEDGWWGAVQHALNNPVPLLTMFEDAPWATAGSDDPRWLLMPYRPQQAYGPQRFGIYEYWGSLEPGLERAGINRVLGDSLDRAKAQLDQTFFAPIRAVDWDQLDGDPFEF